MSKPTWNDTFMRYAYNLSKHSTCLKLKTGAVLVKDNRTISNGYNGSLPGKEHCCDYWKKKATSDDFFTSKEFYESHHIWAQKHEVHGEQNALLFACRNGINTKDTEMYTLYSPCVNCAKAIAMAGIKCVYFNKHYERDSRGVELLEEFGIPCIFIKLDIE